MAAHHLDEGLLGWLLCAGTIAAALTATGLAGYCGARTAIHRYARAGANRLHHF